MAALILLDLAVQGNHLPGRELILQISRMEEKAAQAGASLPDGQLKNRHLPGAEQPRIAHLAHHRRHLARTQF
jgi:hypothetical protein